MEAHNKPPHLRVRGSRNCGNVALQGGEVGGVDGLQVTVLPFHLLLDHIGDQALKLGLRPEVRSEIQGVRKGRARGRDRALGVRPTTTRPPGELK